MSSAEKFQMLAAGAIASEGKIEGAKYKALALEPDHELHADCKNCGNQGIMYLATECLGHVLDIKALRIYFCPKCNHLTVYMRDKPCEIAIVALPNYWRRFIEIERPD
jgi:Zn finger protein HypA/HybF involved in hydrogenase expression